VQLKVSNDPQFAEKLESIVGLYLNPPERAIVLCAEEKSQIRPAIRNQELGPTQTVSAVPLFHSE
jgi:hypothetical protein